MNRASGDLDLIEKVAIPGAEKPSPTSMPLALSPDRRFLYAALRSEPFTAASFAIDPASGRLNHLGNAPLDASMAYTMTDRTGKWLLCRLLSGRQADGQSDRRRGPGAGAAEAGHHRPAEGALRAWSMPPTNTSIAPCWRRT